MVRWLTSTSAAQMHGENAKGLSTRSQTPVWDRKPRNSASPSLDFASDGLRHSARRVEAKQSFAACVPKQEFGHEFQR